jgi:hypothetical protein
LAISRCQDKGVEVLIVQETKKIREVFPNHVYWFFAKVFLNMIIQFTRELKAEMIVLLNYR